MEKKYKKFVKELFKKWDAHPLRVLDGIRNIVEDIKDLQAQINQLKKEKAVMNDSILKLLRFQEAMEEPKPEPRQESVEEVKRPNKDDYATVIGTPMDGVVQINNRYIQALEKYADYMEKQNACECDGCRSVKVEDRKEELNKTLGFTCGDCKYYKRRKLDHVCTFEEEQPLGSIEICGSFEPVVRKYPTEEYQELNLKSNCILNQT